MLGRRVLLKKLLKISPTPGNGRGTHPVPPCERVSAWKQFRERLAVPGVLVAPGGAGRVLPNRGHEMSILWAKGADDVREREGLEIYEPA